jgi:hypothetical protein
LSAGDPPQYGHGRPIKDVLEVMEYDVVQGFDVSKTDTQGFIAKSCNFDREEGDVVIACRGTTPIWDWITNMKGSKVPFNPDALITGKNETGFVHHGFYRAFLSVLPIIKEHALPLIKSDRAFSWRCIGYTNNCIPNIYNPIWIKDSRECMASLVGYLWKSKGWRCVLLRIICSSSASGWKIQLLSFA